MESRGRTYPGSLFRLKTVFVGPAVKSVGALEACRFSVIGYFLNRLSNAARASVAFRGPAIMLLLT